MGQCFYRFERRRLNSCPLTRGGDALTLRTTGIAAVLVSIIAGITSTLLFAAAFQFRADQEPTRLLAAGATSAELLRWGSVLDLFGYYLPTAVLAYVLWRQLRPRNPLLADLSTMAGVGYALAGGAGAAVLAVFGPMLMHDYTEASPTDRVVITAQFTAMTEVIMRSIWQFLDGILIGAWWLGIGLLLRADRPRLSVLTLVLAAVAAVGAFVNLVGLSLVRDVLLGVLFVLWFAWWISVLVVFLRQGETA
jgi:Domain of unknown function (DUF4386)